MKVVTLPEHDEMLKRLVSVNQEPHLREHLYPIYLQRAGEEKVGAGVTMMLALGLYDYTKDFPAPAKNMITAVLNEQVPKFITALVDDEEVRKDALDAWEKALTKSE